MNLRTKHPKYVGQTLSSVWMEHETTPWQAHAHASGTTLSPGDWQPDFQSWRKCALLLSARMLSLRMPQTLTPSAI
ncbi:hypothetical protein FOMPIDRAFT_1052664 [Fomitopsis schrenkii]|uniref:Uncharacterized protein n=1 Tax=Fomitopsis schrenkii TaxID=2126942 RepID=S8DVC7_FOMSC|nr:hypothetical protein FOMPIDRAFT_1052664 [Fomitopsis schrenkii]